MPVSRSAVAVHITHALYKCRAGAFVVFGLSAALLLAHKAVQSLVLYCSFNL